MILKDLDIILFVFYCKNNNNIQKFITKSIDYIVTFKININNSSSNNLFFYQLPMINKFSFIKCKTISSTILFYLESQIRYAWFSNLIINPEV
jgi:hypothetical protein